MIKPVLGLMELERYMKAILYEYGLFLIGETERWM